MPPSLQSCAAFMVGFARAIVAPKGRKHLSAAARFGVVCRRLAALPASRSSDTAISFTEALRAAFALVSLPAPSLLAFETERAEGHGHPIDGMQRVPCDT